MGRILIIDDDEITCKVLSRIVKKMGHSAVYALTLRLGLERASAEAFDVVLLDVVMPDGNGLEFLPRIRGTESKPEVIIITAAGQADGAELAIRSGAWDYIEKVPSLKEMILPISRAIQYRKEKLSRTPPVALRREGIVGSGPKMKACLDLLAQAALSDANVLVTGETGTGKELFAKAIHRNSPRAEENFVVVDCTALPETLVESVLFGYEKGAFTGAWKTREGLVLQADGGTLFLDEIGELPIPVQKAFLRLLQERRFRPVGGKKEINSHFRLVSATNKNLDQMMENGRFRKDLLFRLRSLAIELPPLRERPEDIRALARYHTVRLCDLYKMETKGFSPDFFNALMAYDWPGNVRELVNTIDSALAVAGQDATLFSRHLPVQLRIRMARASVGENSPPDGDTQRGGESELPSLRDFRWSQEKRYLKNLMALTGRDVKKACRVAGISRSRYYELLKKHQMAP